MYSNIEMIQSMIIATAITSIIGSFANNFEKLFGNLMYYVKKMYAYFFDKPENQINVVGTIFKNLYGVKVNFSQEYNAIMALIVKNKKNLKNIYYINNNVDYRFDDYGKEDDHSFKKYKFYVNSDIKIIIDDDIFASFHEYEEEKGKDNPYSTKYLTISITSKKYTTPELQEKISKWTKEFQIENKLYKDDGNIYHYSLNCNNNKNIESLCEEKSKKNQDDIFDNNNNDNNKKWAKNRLISFKTFDNIFFEEKEIMMKKLNYFLKNEEKYKKKGIPYNIGFLFYGDPGCGKTSCIKAISNYTNRHVVEINLKQIETCGEFIDIFNNESMNDNCIPHNKKMIVLEDIDCMIDIVKSRDNEAIEDQKSKEMDKILDLLLEKKKEKFKKDDKLSLSCILNTIDGVYENYGRILIITTNYADRLDKALIRPGRIDMKIHFTKATSIMCHDMIENFFDHKITQNIELPDKKYTPAEILEICALHEDDMEKAIQSIIS
jgi:AAA+ superfamily predicted ATPase